MNIKHYATFDSGFIGSIRPLTDSEHALIVGAVELCEVSHEVASQFAAYKGGRCRLVGGQLEFVPDAPSLHPALLLRAQMLRSSDWTQLPDVPMTLEQRTQWATYRQALRDITAQPGYPFNIIWPTPPA